MSPIIESYFNKKEFPISKKDMFLFIFLYIGAILVTQNPVQASNKTIKRLIWLSLKENLCSDGHLLANLTLVRVKIAMTLKKRAQNEKRV